MSGPLPLYEVNPDGTTDQWAADAAALTPDPKEMVREIQRLTKKLAEAEAYADKLVAGLPDGILPKDVELLREANCKMAQQINDLRKLFEQIHEQAEFLRERCQGELARNQARVILEICKKGKG